MNDFLSALKQQVQLWLTTTGHLLSKPGTFVRSPAPGGDAAVAYFNPYYYLAISLFIAFEFSHFIVAAEETGSGGGKSVMEATNKVIGLLQGAGFIQIILPLLLPFGTIAFIYWLCTHMLFRHQQEHAEALRNNLLYYGALVLLVFPLVLFTANLVVNVILLRQVPLLAQEIEDGLLFWSLLVSGLFVVALLVLVLAQLPARQPPGNGAQPQRNGARRLLYVLLLPMPLLATGVFVERYGQYMALHNTPRAVRLVHAWPSRLDRPVDGCRLRGFAPVASDVRGTVHGKTFISDRIFCFNAGTHTLILDRDCLAYARRHTQEHEQDPEKLCTAFDVDQKEIDFHIHSWEPPDSEHLVIRPGDLKWLCLSIEEKKLPKKLFNGTSWLETQVNFNVVGADEPRTEAVSFNIHVK